MVQILDRPLQLMAEDCIVEEGYTHRPVLLHEVIEYLAPRSGGLYIDGTVGEGGHASAILQVAAPGGRLLGIDLDPQALERAGSRLQEYRDLFVPARASYAHVAEVADDLGFRPADGILLDLGLSSLQLGDSGRGFSFQREEPLDMRYDPEGDLTTADIVNRYPQEELARILSSYGEEPRAKAIARAVAGERPLRSTRDLADLVLRVYGGRRGRTHPATRTFQALRIAVNSELDNVRTGLEAAISLLKPLGRLAVISYHSLEDRIVKETMAREARDCICPPRLPACVCGHTASLKILSRKIITPSREEILGNPSSRSARMRVAERLTGQANRREEVK